MHRSLFCWTDERAEYEVWTNQPTRPSKPTNGKGCSQTGPVHKLRRVVSFVVDCSLTVYCSCVRCVYDTGPRGMGCPLEKKKWFRKKNENWKLAKKKAKRALEKRKWLFSLGSENKKLQTGRVFWFSIVRSLRLMLASLGSWLAPFLTHLWPHHHTSVVWVAMVIVTIVMWLFTPG